MTTADDNHTKTTGRSKYQSFTKPPEAKKNSVRNWQETPPQLLKNYTPLDTEETPIQPPISLPTWAKASRTSAASSLKTHLTPGAIIYSIQRLGGTTRTRHYYTTVDLYIDRPATLPPNPAMGNLYCITEWAVAYLRTGNDYTTGAMKVVGGSRANPGLDVVKSLSFELFGDSEKLLHRKM